MSYVEQKVTIGPDGKHIQPKAMFTDRGLFYIAGNGPEQTEIIVIQAPSGLGVFVDGARNVLIGEGVRPFGVLCLGCEKISSVDENAVLIPDNST